MIHLDFSIQDAWNYIAPVLGITVGKLFDVYINKRKILKEKKKADPVAEALKHNAQIDVKLDSLLDEFECDRITLMQFHNGGNLYPSGKSSIKFSIFYESVRPGVTPLRERYQNIPVSIFSKSINFVAENNLMTIPDVKNLPLHDADVLGFSKNTDSKSQYIIAIKSIDNKLVGMLTIFYVKKKKNLTDERVTDLQLQAAALGSGLHLNG